MIRTRFAALSVILVSLAAITPLAAADPPAVPIDDVKLFDGVLPGATSDDEVATLVVDAATGQPVPGARVRWYPEDIRKTTTDYNALLAEGVSDANGVATVAWEAERSGLGGKAEHKSGGHWIAIADGYAPEHEFGERPPSRMELRRGAPYVGRLIDGWGRPVANAPIEGWLGCSHGPTVFRARSDADGLFRFEHAPDAGMRLWIIVPGFAAPHAFLEDPGLGERPHEIVLKPAPVYRGVVLDAGGSPLRGAVVRGESEGVEREGPFAVTGADGDFVLAGHRWDNNVFLWHPHASGALLMERLVSDRPLRVRLAGIRPEFPRDETDIKVRLRDEDGKPVGGSFLLVGDDGLSYQGWASSDDADRGEAKVGVRFGAYDVRPLSPFSVGVTPQRVLIDAENASTPIVVRTRRRPVLKVESVNEHADPAVVHLPAAWTTLESPSSESDLVYVPADIPAVVRQGDAWGIVGPVETGNVRRAVLRTPSRHRVRWPAGLDVNEASLLYRGAPVIAERDGDSIVTRAAGDLTLRLEWKGDRKPVELPVRLPVEPDAAVEVEVDPSKTSNPSPDDGISLSVLLADGTRPEWLKLTATDGKQNYSEAGSEPPLSLWGPLKMRSAVIRAEVDGLMPLVARVDRPGKHELRWGSGRLTLKVVDGDDKPVASSVLLDGELFELRDGALEIGGLAAGAHRAIVASADEKGRGRAWRFSIRDGTVGQRVEKTLRLGEVK